MDATNPTTTPAFLWGAAAIGEFLGISTKAVFHLLERGALPARKVGDRWVCDREVLRRHLQPAAVEG